jgi:cholestenol delta-isomerase
MRRLWLSGLCCVSCSQKYHKNTTKIPQKYHKNIRSGNPANLPFGAAGGFIHLFFEGYFGYTASRIAGNTHLFAQLWKEYALSDSRYMSYDAFTVAMERITAVSSPGPLSNRPSQVLHN